MIVLSGRSCTGKDTVQRELVKRGFQKLVTYTSRPMRSGETQDIEYHFISAEEFKDKINEGFFAEHRVYHTEVNGQSEDWFYGSAADDIKNASNNTITILTPEGVSNLKRNCDDNIFVIYLFSNDKTVIKRQKMRCDDQKEAKRRFDADKIDFKGFELVADKIVYNNVGSDIDQVVEKIITLIKENVK